MNSIGLDADRDLGQDGAQQSTFNKDEYAYALNYYDGDYEARGGTDLLGETFYTNENYSLFTGYQDKVGGVAYNRESLYNGNIAAMATSIRNLGEERATQSMNYRYDQLHRIAAAHATKWYEGNWTTTAGSYNTSYGYDKNGNIQYLYRNDRDAVTIDDLEYHYDPIKKNRLDIVKDGGTAEGLNNANPYEYNYDNIGNLIKNEEDGIEDIEWNIYGKVEQVTKTDGTEISYRYDGTGNRIMKKITVGATSTTTTYLRDASGNVMAIYEEKTDQTLVIKEIPIYGSSRLGQYRPKTDAKKTALGQRIYEFSNHLGNVLVTLTDHKVPQTDGTYSSVVLSASDYYPFGMAMAERTYSNSEYRYGFNGREKDNEFSESVIYKERIYDPVIARWKKVDGRTDLYPYSSPYVFTGNNPNANFEQDGDIFGTIIGGIIGAAVNTGIALYKNSGKPKDQRVNVWKEAGKGFLAGAAAGAVVDLTIATAGTGTVALLAVGAASGAVGNVVQQGLDNLDGTRNDFSVGEVALSAGLGAGLGYLGGKIAPYVGQAARYVRGLFRRGRIEVGPVGMGSPQIGTQASNLNQAGLQRLNNHVFRRFNTNKPALRRINAANEIPASTNGASPDFTGTRFVHRINGEQSITRITLTGNRADDFAAANAAVGLTETPTGFTWHHLDDFNPATGTSTMQLVETQVHRATAPHAGSVKQYQLYHDSGY